MTDAYAETERLIAAAKASSAQGLNLPSPP